MMLDKLKTMASRLGVEVGEADVPSGLYVPAGAVLDGAPPVIILPKAGRREYRAWVLAHELGHHILGHRRGNRPYIIQEIEAWNHAKKLMTT